MCALANRAFHLSFIISRIPERENAATTPLGSPLEMDEDEWEPRLPERNEWTREHGAVRWRVNVSPTSTWNSIQTQLMPPDEGVPPLLSPLPLPFRPTHLPHGAASPKDDISHSYIMHGWTARSVVES
jgi:hypothetical protein